MIARFLTGFVSIAAGAAILYAIGHYLGWDFALGLAIGLIVGGCGDAALLVVSQYWGRR